MAYRPRRLLIAAIPLVLTASACGGDSKPKASPSQSGTPTATGTPSASATGSADASASARPSTPGGSSSSTRPGSSSGGTSSSPGATSRPGGSSSPAPLFLTLRLAQTCIVPGEEQYAAIRTVPGAEFIIDTVYADKKEGTVHGGFKHDKADKEGHYNYTWRVLPGTPPGDAWTVVRAGKDGKRGQAVKRFRVAAIC